MHRTRRTDAGAAAARELRVQRAQASSRTVPDRRRPRRAGRAARRSASCSPTCPTTTCQISSGAGRGAAAQHRRPARPLRGRGQGRASSWRRSTASAAIHLRLPRPAAPSRIGIVLNTIEATMRTEELLRQSQALAERAAEPAGTSCSRPTRSSRSKAQQLAEQNAEVEREEPARSSRRARRSRRRPSSSR